MTSQMEFEGCAVLNFRETKDNELLSNNKLAPSRLGE